MYLNLFVFIFVCYYNTAGVVKVRPNLHFRGKKANFVKNLILYGSIHV